MIPSQKSPYQCSHVNTSAPMFFWGKKPPAGLPEGRVGASVGRGGFARAATHSKLDARMRKRYPLGGASRCELRILGGLGVESRVLDSSTWGSSLVGGVQNRWNGRLGLEPQWVEGGCNTPRAHWRCFGAVRNVCKGPRRCIDRKRGWVGVS